MPHRNVLLVDDHPMWVDAVRNVVDDPRCPFVLAAAASTGAQARTELASRTFGLVLLDLTLPDCDGLELLADITATYPDLPVLVLTAAEPARVSSAVLQAKGAGVVPKTTTGPQLREAMLAAADRRIYVHPEVLSVVLDAGAPERVSGRPDLTAAEQEVLMLLCAGVLTTADLAARLHLSSRSVKARLSGVFAKLEVTDRAGAVAAAYRDGYVVAGDASRR